VAALLFLHNSKYVKINQFLHKLHKTQFKHNKKKQKRYYKEFMLLAMTLLLHAYIAAAV